jgi:hypothetical protein
MRYVLLFLQMRKAYNIPEDLHHRVRLAAAGGSDRLSKGALQAFVVGALRRAVENPRPGFGLPKLTLCALCFEKNRVRVARVRTSGTVPFSAYETRSAVVESEPQADRKNLFDHLIAQMRETK